MSSWSNHVNRMMKRTVQRQTETEAEGLVTQSWIRHSFAIFAALVKEQHAMHVQKHLALLVDTRLKTSSLTL